MRKTVISIIQVIVGIAMVAVGLVLIKTITEPQGVLRALPYVLIGVGCGTFGYGMGEAVSQRVSKKHPEIAKQAGIEAKDERNIAIGNRARARAYDMMIYVLSALILAFALMGVDVIVILLLVFSYLFLIGCNIFYYVKYQKEM